MTTLHTFGCSITQGFALPDVIRHLSDAEIVSLGRPLDWTDTHLYQPSDHAWPSVLAGQLGMSVNNSARRGACFQQIARQCAVGVKHIAPTDTVIVMWTYMSRLSLQWPARTTVPFANIVDPNFGWKTIMVGFNKLFGLSPSDNTNSAIDLRIQQYIEDSTKNTYLDPLGIYNRHYNSMVLQVMTDGFLRSTGARVIHLSVEMDSSIRQLEYARLDLEDSLREPYVIPHPDQWYTVKVDHASCELLHDDTIPMALGNTHPSVRHHANFARHIQQLYF